jgi:hypothetical protein
MRLRLYLVPLLCSVVSLNVAAQAEPEAAPAVEPAAEPPPAAAPEPDPELAAAEAEEERLLAAAAAGEVDDETTYHGASLGLEGIRSLDSRVAASLGISASYSVRTFGQAGIGQIGLTAWPAAFELHNGDHTFAGLELFGAATLLPLSFGPVSLGVYVKLTYGIHGNVPGHIVPGISAVWSLDRIWSLRYQIGCAFQTNFVAPQLVSALALDMLFPYLGD